jgi:hypothetical protein
MKLDKTEAIMANINDEKKLIQKKKDEEEKAKKDKQNRSGEYIVDVIHSILLLLFF